MQNMFDKDTSRWVMKRAHELAKKDRSLGRRMRDGYIVTYADCFKQALRTAHGEAKVLLGVANNVATYITEIVTEGANTLSECAKNTLRALRDQAKAVDTFSSVNFHKAYMATTKAVDLLAEQAEQVAGIVKNF